MTEHVDVLIVGAGLSGIGAAAQLTRTQPGRSYVVLEARATSGGTWDLFRYPGIRSDSDMFTLGYRFRPWRGERSLAPGAAILDYVRETAREYHVERHIRYDHRVVSADWDSATARWRIVAEHAGDRVELTCGFLWSCAGYYDYDAGYTPEMPGLDRFTGPVVHPQHWPPDLEYAGKQVLVVGSGATAVTLVPALALGLEGPAAGHVTMLQRSPTYVLSLPGRDALAQTARRRLPAKAAYQVVRWKNILVSAGFYRLARRRPALVRRMIRKATVQALPEGYPVDVDFNPRYDPWDQRLCFVPDADLFRAISQGRADVVTGTIDTFTEGGVRLASGRELAADVVVTATGLTLVPFGKVRLSVDGVPVDLSATMAYRALMLSGVPNFVFTIGYTNASWTLKADLVAEFVCRLLDHLDRHGYRSVVPVRDPSVAEAPFMDFSAGYVLRALDRLPRQGSREPWRLQQSYLHDRRTLRHADLDDAALAFTR
ncbi:MAG TPA: NAD(P)/FAD-dependent oxidoreductase [Nocardioides sp.]|uniref:flavin-containing monooxygenase n=1 Tax=Nocardioides sp. TaxID=35761 RepID=UPI002C62A2C4|nr:NAD(P)/FAD-dependent oxidoreductase [Nocardioides sp.]HQR27540.1 NAD(P)/FAD-dependent oxidoreductase [Nocardioides sp.]